MVSPQWNMSKLFRIHSARYSIQDLSQVLPCMFYVFEDFISPDILLSASLRLGKVEFTVPNKAPRNFPGNGRHHHKFQNSHLQHTYRRYSPEATQQKWLQGKTHYKTAFSIPSITSYPLTGPFVASFQDHQLPLNRTICSPFSGP